MIVFPAPVAAWSSPRAWGCFCSGRPCRTDGAVFPTCVGVFLSRQKRLTSAGRLPHVRGGVSFFSFLREAFLLSSPRAWGCFLFQGVTRQGESVFPTCVGVFPFTAPSSGVLRRLPHVRGGVSIHMDSIHRTIGSSPRAWGCFSFLKPSPYLALVFPTCVGVFPFAGQERAGRRRLPHVRGGVSEFRFRRPLLFLSSPRAWGCFLIFILFGYDGKVFPTCVGVFLQTGDRRRRRSGLPHVRGGVSYALALYSLLRRSSPRAWGCFPLLSKKTAPPSVFPTCVGVFPKKIRKSS